MAGEGYIQVALILVVILGAYGMITYLGHGIINDLNNDIQNDSTMSVAAQNMSGTITNQYPSFSDGLFGLILGLFWIGGLVAAYFSDTNPLLFIIFVLVTVFLMIASGMISNMWEEFIADSTFASITSSYPITNFVMNNFLVVMGVFLFSGFITLFMKNRVL